MTSPLPTAPAALRAALVLAAIVSMPSLTPGQTSASGAHASDAPALKLGLGRGTPAKIWRETARIVAEDAATSAGGFGIAVAIDADTLAVRQRANTYVFVRTSNGWTQQARLVPPGSIQIDEETVALDGDVLAVGHPGDSIIESFGHGTVAIYHRSAATWTQEFAASGGPTDYFGHTLAVDGDLACISGGFTLPAFFRRVGESWAYVGGLCCVPSCDVTASTVLADDRLFVGVSKQESCSTGGRVLCYEFVPHSFVLRQTLVSEDQTLDDFGCCIAASGDTLAVGAPRHDAFGADCGAVYLYEREDGTWHFREKLAPCDAAPNLHFGRAVAIEGSTLVVGAQWQYAQSGALSPLGALYVFERAPNGWQPTQKLATSEAATKGGFGRCVALDEGTIVAGAQFDDGPAPDCGAVYVFERDVPSAPAFCFGDGSAVACPCGNDGASGHGCASGSGAPGARLDAYGVASVSDDSVVLSCTGVPPGSMAVVWQGSVQENGGFGSPHFDGLRCISGSFVNVGIATSCTGTVTYPNGGAPSVAVLGGISASGGTRHYQVWYTGAVGPCGWPTNTSNGVSVTWSP